MSVPKQLSAREDRDEKSPLLRPSPSVGRQSSREDVDHDSSSSVGGPSSRCGSDEDGPPTDEDESWSTSYCWVVCCCVCLRVCCCCDTFSCRTRSSKDKDKDKDKSRLDDDDENHERTKTCCPCCPLFGILSLLVVVNIFMYLIYFPWSLVCEKLEKAGILGRTNKPIKIFSNVFQKVSQRSPGMTMVVVSHYIVLVSETNLDKVLESVWELFGGRDTDMFWSQVTF